MDSLGILGKHLLHKAWQQLEFLRAGAGEKWPLGTGEPSGQILSEIWMEAWPGTNLPEMLTQLHKDEPRHRGLEWGSCPGEPASETPVLEGWGLGIWGQHSRQTGSVACEAGGHTLTARTATGVPCHLHLQTHAGCRDTLTACTREGSTRHVCAGNTLHPRGQAPLLCFRRGLRGPVGGRATGFCPKSCAQRGAGSRTTWNQSAPAAGCSPGQTAAPAPHAPTAGS